MTNHAQQRDPVEALAEEFLARRRAGETPSIESYATAHPELADEIRDLFPAMMVMERLKPASESASDQLATIKLPTTRLGEYNIVREIGRGGMGVVYEAEQESLGRRVAIKLLPNNALASETYVQRFEREARAAAGLHHTNIVPVFGNGKHDNLHFYVMQFIHGCGLDVVLKELKRLRHSSPGHAGPTEPVSIAVSLLTAQAPEAEDDAATEPIAGSDIESVVLPGQQSLGATSTAGDVYWSSVARIGEQVADAIHYAHSQGVLHRDIKPSNLLLDTRGNVWITDFGLAKVIEDDNLTRSGDIVGTMRYMAPERFRGESSATSDTYSLGATLYELLTMQPAFDTADAQKLIADLTREPPLPPRRINPAIPADLQTIVMTAMATDPKDRYQSAGALAEDLKRFREGRPIVARKASLLERAAKFVRRKPLISTLAAGLVVAVIGMAVQWRKAVANADDAFRQSTANKLLAKKEQNAKNAEATAREQVRVQLATTRASVGHRAMEDGDYGSAMVLLANARDELLQSAGDDTRKLAKPIDICLSNIVSRHPRLAHFDCDGSVSRLSPCGKFLMSSLRSGGNRVTDLRSPDTSRRYGKIRFPHAQTGPLTESTWQGLHIPKDGPVEFVDLRTGESLSSISADAQKLIRGTKSLSIMSASARRLGIWKNGWFYCLDGKREPFRAIQQPKAWLISPDGSTLFVAPQSEGKPELWDLNTGERIGQLDYEQGTARNTEVLKAAFSSDGSLLVGRTPLKGHAWDVATHKLVATYDIARPETRSVTACPDGEHFLMIDADNTVRTWHPRSNEVIAEASQPNRVHQLAISPDGLYFATSCDDLKVRLWSTFDGKQVGPAISHAEVARTLSFSPGGRFLFTRSGVSRIWDLSHLTTRTAWLAHEGGVTALRVTADGLQTAGADGFVRTWRLNQDGQPVASRSTAPMQHAAPVTAIFFSEDRSKLVSRTKAGRVQLWDTATGKPLSSSLTGPRGKPSATSATSNDGKILIVYDDRYNVFDAKRRVDDYGNVSHLGVGVPLVRQAAITSDGTVVCSRDHTNRVAARFIRTGTGIELSRLCSSFELIGKRTLVSNETDGTIRVWSLTETDSPSSESLCMAEISHGTSSARLMQTYTQGPENRAVIVSRSNEVRTLSLAGSEGAGTPGFRPSFTVRLVTTDQSSQQPALLLAGEHEAQLWDAATSLPLTPLLSHDASITAIGSGHDSIWVATADGRVHQHRWQKSPGPSIGAVEVTAAQQISAATALSMSRVAGNLTPLSVDDYSARLHDSSFDVEDGKARWHAARFAQAKASGHTFAASWHLERWREVARDNTIARHEAAGIAFNSGDFDRVVALLADLPNPTAAQLTLRARGYIRLGLERYSAAASDLRTAHELSNSEPLLLLADALESLGGSRDVTDHPELPEFLSHENHQLWSKRTTRPARQVSADWRMVTTELKAIRDAGTHAEDKLTWFEAVCQVATGNRTEAIDILAATRESSHKLLQARVAADLGKWEQVLESVNQFVERAGSDGPLPHYLRGLATQSLAAKEPSAQQLSEIEEACNTAIEIDGKHVPSLLLRSQVRMRTGQFGAAASDLEQIVTLNPHEPNVLQLQAIALANSGKLQAARDALSKAIEITPQPAFYDLRIRLHNAIGNPEAAAADYRILMERLAGAGVERIRNQNLFGPFLATCATANRLDMFEEWLEQMDRTYALNPKETTALPRAWLSVIRPGTHAADVQETVPAALKPCLLYRAGQFAEAEAQLTALDTPSATQLIFLAMLRARRGNFDGAEEILDKIEVRPGSIESYLAAEARAMLRSAQPQ